MYYDWLEHQYEQVEKQKDFVNSLDRNKIVFLSELHENPDKALDKLNANWFHYEILFEKLENTFNYLRQAKDCLTPIEDNSLIFFQKENLSLDRKALKEIKQITPGIDFKSTREKYLTTNVNYALTLNNTSKGKILKPLMNYSNPHTNVKGYNFTDYCRALRIDEEIASEYFIRMLIHDLGHKLIPHTNHEGLHNAIMIYASQTKFRPEINSMHGPVFQEILPKENQEFSEWEKMIYHEATNPIFPLIGPEFLRAYEAKNELEKKVVSKYKKWYLGYNESYWADKEEEMYELYGIETDMGLPEKIQRFKSTIKELVKTEFEDFFRTNKIKNPYQKPKPSKSLLSKILHNPKPQENIKKSNLSELKKGIIFSK